MYELTNQSTPGGPKTENFRQNRNTVYTYSREPKSMYELKISIISLLECSLEYSPSTPGEGVDSVWGFRLAFVFTAGGSSEQSFCWEAQRQSLHQGACLLFRTAGPVHNSVFLCCASSIGMKLDSDEWVYMLYRWPIECQRQIIHRPLYFVINIHPP